LASAARLGKLRAMSDIEPAKLQAIITALFPADVAVCYSSALPTDARLEPEEAAATPGMVPARHTEFLLGRHCAREAMRQLGHEPLAVPKHADRSPVWPPGLVGTISHFGRHAAAAVAWSDEYRGVGLDLESSESLTAEIAEMVCRPDESAGPANGKLLFSIKEAIYKCIYPEVGHYVDFQDMEVRLGADGCYTAVPHHENLDSELIARLEGRYYRSETMVIASAWLPN
jgi:4'-phosphopantetheinyl transferase EntD